VSGARRVLVTGASRGIGRAVLRRLAEDGYAPAGVARTRPSDLGAGESFEVCDLSDLDATRGLAARLAAGAPFYGIVNNAAVTQAGPMEGVTLADMAEASQVNVYAPMLLTQALVPGMRGLGHGRVVNISASAALGSAGRTAYSASKAALAGVTRTWALELAPFNITVNAISPAAIESRDRGAPGPRAGPDGAGPLLRAGRPQAVAHVIAFLLDDLAGFITGQNIRVDGGLSISAVRP
jgi:3-oxoacyl-[acyl-carrier protein] reductase